jgi:hypothetical protein
MAKATKTETYMLKLINAERAEAGLKALRFDGDLNQAADTHTRWMLAQDVFSHTGAGGSSVKNRAEAAGYNLTGSWAIGENLGLQSERGAEGIRDDVRAIHEALMNSPGHRANILSRNYDEAGIGIKLGEYNGMTVVMVTQNFGRTSDDDRPGTRNATVASSAPLPDDFVFATKGDTGLQPRPSDLPDTTRPPAPVETDFAVYDLAWSNLI